MAATLTNADHRETGYGRYGYGYGYGPSGRFKKTEILMIPQADEREPHTDAAESDA